MWSLGVPGSTEAETLDASRSRLRPAHGRTIRINGARNGILAEMETYRDHANATTLHTIVPHNTVAGTVSCDDMNCLYTGGMVSGGGRAIYDKIMGLAPNSRCPYCGHRLVRQLDHFLPKKKYPAFSVTPLNLIPSCSDCNKDKLADDASQLAHLPLHPYFDDIDQEEWLVANIAPGPMPVFLFDIDHGCGLSPIELTRLGVQFEGLDLGELYTTVSNEELSSIRLILRSLLHDVGPNGVEEYLHDHAVSNEAHQRNSWKTAMYRAAWQDAWFVNGGFDDPDLP